MKKSKFYLTLLVLVMAFFTANAAVIPVAEGTDVLSAAISSAADGDIIELTTDGGIYAESGKFSSIDHSITIRAAEGLTNRPIIRTPDADYMFKLTGANSRYVFKGLEIDGSNDGESAVMKYFIRIDNGDPTGTTDLFVDDCYVHHSQDKFIKPYANTGLDTMMVTNSIFHDNDKEGIVFYSGSSSDPAVVINDAIVENCTFYNIEREAIKAQTHPDTKVRINRCTFYNIGENEKKGMVYFRDMTDVVVKNSIFSVNNNADAEKFADFESDVSLFHNNSVWATTNFEVGKATVSDTVHMDPEFADAANGDFTLPETSSLLTFADDGGAIGDPRWTPGGFIPTVYPVEAGEDNINAAIDEAGDGDIIELVTSGGLYYETNSLYIEGKSLTIRAKEGLTQKPKIQNDDYGESNGVFKIKSGGNLTLQGVEFFNAKHLIRIDNDSTNCVVKIDDCYGHTGKETLIKVYAGSWVDSLIVTNTILRDSEKEGIYLKEPNTFGYAKFENSTFIHTGREAIRVRDNDSAVMLINHCTFDSICYNEDYRAIYPEGVQNLEFKNSIITNQLGSSEEVVKLYGTSSFHHNNVWNADSTKGEIQLEDAATASDTLFVDPLYNNPARDDYRLADTSPCRGAADDGMAMGDLRWEVSPSAYYLTVIVEGNGSVSLDPAGGVYDPGTSVTITAIPDENWNVSHWEPATFPPDAETYSVTMDASKEVKVVFEPNLEKYPLMLSTVGVGHIDYEPMPLDTADMTYYEGTEITLTAVSDTSGMEFTGWSGDITATENPVVVTIDSAMNIAATFTPITTQYTLNIDTVGLGEVLLDPEPFLDYGTYDSASVVTLTALGYPGFVFESWSGAVTGTDPVTTVQVDSNLTVVANFVEAEVTGGRLEVDTTIAFLEAVEFARNNSQVDTLVLTTDGGVYHAPEYVEVNFDLTVMAAPGLTTRPKVKGNADLSYASGVFQIKASDTEEVIDLTLKGLEISGAKYQLRTDDDSLNTVIKIDDCYLHDAGEVLIKIYPKSFVDSLIVTNSMFRECTKEGIYLKEMMTVGYVRLENSTFLRTGREALRMRGNPDAVVRINHCTFDSISWDKDYRMVYPEEVLDCQVHNSIFSNQLFANERHEDFLRVYGTSTVSNIVVHNASNHVDPEDDAVVDTTTIWDFDPMFADPASRNYTLLAESHAYEIGTDGEAIGDLTWATNTPTHVFLDVDIVEAGIVTMSPEPVGLSYDLNQEVTLTAIPDSGYQFVQWSGGASGSDNPIALTLDQDMAVTAEFVEIEVGIDEGMLPNEYSLSQNYPNPFNPGTNIKFGVKEPGFTTLKVYNLRGQEVASYVNKNLQPGYYNIYVDLHLPSGMYFYKLKSGSFVKVRRMMLLK